jgi:hypothetical protein
MHRDMNYLSLTLNRLLESTKTWNGGQAEY